MRINTYDVAPLEKIAKRDPEEIRDNIEQIISNIVARVSSKTLSQDKAQAWLTKFYSIIDEKALDDLTDVVDILGFRTYVARKDGKLTWNQMQRFLAFDDYLNILLADYPSVLVEHRLKITEYVLTEDWYHHQQMKVIGMLFDACMRKD